MVPALLLWVLAALAAGSACYSLAAAWAAWRFGARGPEPAPARRPRVSILKPVRGPDALLLAGLRSHADLDYPNAEILIGVADDRDPALPDVRRFQSERPERSIQVLVSRPAPGGNPKVALLDALADRAAGELLLVGDVDIVVPPDLLDRMIARLDEPGVRLVTCLYRSRPGSRLASRLDALWVSTEFPAQALVGEAVLGGLAFAFGAAILIRRDDLAAIGGFAAIRPYLADDYQLGARTVAQGGRVALCRTVVETATGASTLADVWRRHLRWSRNIRVSKPAGHFGLFWTFTTLWSLALALASSGTAPWVQLAAAALVARLLAAAATAKATGFRAFWSLVWLLPATDLFAAAVWLASFASRDVTWRGRRLRLDPDGRIR